jgi:Immunoglobulin I-set domain.
VTATSLPDPSKAVNEHDTITFNCTVEGYPRPTVTWKNDGVAMTTNITETSASNVTGIWVVTSEINLHLAREHAGIIGCFATNGIGTETNATTSLVMTCENNFIFLHFVVLSSVNLF